MRVNIPEADLAYYMFMNGAEFLGFDSATQCYDFESNQTKSKWRFAFNKSEFSTFARGTSEFLTLKKEANKHA